MDKIKILYIIDVFFKVAGAERNLYEVATRLDRDKFEPIIACLNYGDCLNVFEEKGITAIDLKIDKIYSFKAVKAALALIRLIKERNVKIVVTYHEGSDFFGLLIARLAGVKVVISSRRDMGYRLKKVHILIYRLINRYFNKILTVSDAVKEIIFERENTLWNRLRTIYTSVDMEKFAQGSDADRLREEFKVQKGHKIVGMLAALRPIKGHQYFIEAAARVLKEYTDVSFLIVGWYEETMAYYVELKDLVEKLGVGNNVIFTGGRLDTPAVLSLMNISVLSSINEGFPNAALEAMASGKPMVATNSGGTPEAVIDGKTGMLVPPRDPEKLAEAILKLLNEPDTARQMGESGRKRARDVFLMDKMIETMERFYEELLKEKTRKKAPVSAINNISYFLRKMLRGFARYSGLFRLYKIFLNPDKGIKIIAYHRVNNDHFDPLGMNVKIDFFERQVRYIKKHCSVISLEDALQMLEGAEEIPPNAVVITFDDGYRDNYLNAFPILKKYGIPATLFITVDPIEQKTGFWFDTIISAISKTRQNSVDMAEFTGNDYPLNGFRDKLVFIKDSIRYAKTLAPAEREKFISCLLGRLKISGKEICDGNLPLNWDEIREMNKTGISFGSHGLSHTILTNLSREELIKEIRDSKKIIEEKLSKKILDFAYPNGGTNDFNLEIAALLESEGYRSGVSLMKGANNGSSDLFALKRYYVNPIAESALAELF